MPRENPIANPDLCAIHPRVHAVEKLRGLPICADCVRVALKAITEQPPPPPRVRNRRPAQPPVDDSSVLDPALPAQGEL
jgi:hypothetical protein